MTAMERLEAMETITPLGRPRDFMFVKIDDYYIDLGRVREAQLHEDGSLTIWFGHDDFVTFDRTEDVPSVLAILNKRVELDAFMREARLIGLDGA